MDRPELGPEDIQALKIEDEEDEDNGDDDEEEEEGGGDAQRAARAEQRKRVSTTTAHPAVGDESESDRRSDEEEASKREFHAAPTHAIREQGPEWSSRLFQAKHAKMMIQSHPPGRYGRLFPLGTHPSGSWAYAQTNDATTTFTELDPRTPIIFVNIARIELSDHRIPHDGRGQKQFRHVSLGETPSIYILIPDRGTLDDPRLNCFLVSSAKLATEARKKVNEKFDAALSEDIGSPCPVELVGGEMIDQFATSEASVMPLLYSLMRGHGGESKHPDGNVFGVTDREGFMALLSTKREAARQFMLQELAVAKLSSLRQKEEKDRAAQEMSLDTTVTKNEDCE